jgi:chemosensory pili system protein ChpC
MSTEQTELYSLLIPLRNERLLVPRMCVLEVITSTEAERSPDDDSKPEWYLGSILWNGRRLPVLSFDPPGEEVTARRRGRSRIVVFQPIGEATRGGFFGVLTQGFPQLVRVNRDVLQADSDQQLPELPPSLCRARMIHEFPLIPDLERIERMVAELGITD